MKRKTYVIILSKTFPEGHSNKGQNTYFKEQILNALLDNAGVSACDCCPSAKRNCSTCGHKASNFRKKIHTIRDNYELWEKRIKEVQADKAIISIRQWSGRPYWSTQEIICDLGAKDGVGIQEFNLLPFDLLIDKKAMNSKRNMQMLAENDGLDYVNFHRMFICGQASPTKAIIHFTKFRY